MPVWIHLRPAPDDDTATEAFQNALAELEATVREELARIVDMPDAHERLDALTALVQRVRRTDR